MEDYGPNGNGNQQRTEGFGETTALAINETASTAAAEQAKAEVQSRFIMALRRPRNMDDVRLKLLKECKRSTFAEVALYSKPVGKGSIEGLSIRFAEAAIRCLGNLMPQTMVIYDDDEKLIGRVALTDLEGNVTFQKDIVVRKVVERKSLKRNQKSLGERLNSYGDKVYLVSATDDDVINKFNSLESKALRNHTMRVLPGDIQDECKEQIKKTSRERVRDDPDGTRKKIVDDFASIGVRPPDLVSFLGHDLDAITDSEGERLWGIYQAIKTGEATWKDFADADQGDVDEPTPKKRTNKVKDLLGKKTAKKPTIVDAKIQAIKTGEATWKDFADADQGDVDEPTPKKRTIVDAKLPADKPAPQDQSDQESDADEWDSAIEAAKEKHGIEVLAMVHHALGLPKSRDAKWTGEQMALSKVACEVLIDSARTPTLDEMEMFSTLVRDRANW